jgi:hypothetical protein
MKRLLSLALGALVLSAFTAGSVNAQNSFTFAQFSKLGTVPATTKQFSFVNNGVTGAGRMLTGTATNALVTFSFLNTPFLANAGLAGEIVKGSLNFSTLATDTASLSDGAITQPTVFPGTLDITYNGVNGAFFGGVQFFTGDVLLSVDFDSGRIVGRNGGQAAALAASRPSDAVTFTADSKFFNFANITEEGFGVILTGLTSTLGISATNSLLDSFNADGSGGFAASVIPEPASLAMAGLGLLGVALVARRRLVK